jgi:hypothetical protein
VSLHKPHADKQGFSNDYARLAGLNTITGGAGADSLTGGAGADDFVMTSIVTNAGVLGVDSITDFNIIETDQIGNYSVGNLELLVSLSDLVQITDTTVSQGAGAVLTSVTGDITGGYNMAASAAGTNLLLISGDFADAGTVQASIRANVFNNSTALQAEDGFMIAYDDGTDTYIALVTTATGNSAGNFIADAVVTNLTILEGVADATSITSLSGSYLNFIS